VDEEERLPDCGIEELYGSLEVKEEDVNKITTLVLTKLDERLTEKHPKPQLMLDWLLAEAQKDKTCRRCMLRPTAEWYYSELEENGYDKLAAVLQEAADTEDKPQICATFDEIKTKVDAKVRATLEDFDWFTQDAAVALENEELESDASSVSGE
jgi:hypothetical protein